jgi:hypothetical protein
VPELKWIDEKNQCHFNFHAGQSQVYRCDRRFVLMLAGSQSGKTAFGPIWLLREIQKRGPGDYLAVTASFPLLNLKMLPEFRSLFEHTLHLGEWRETSKCFNMKDGSRVIFGSATNAESLESATAKAAWLDEAGQSTFRLGAWEAIQRRLSLHQGRALITTTPYNLGWLKSQVYDRWRAGDPDYAVIQFASPANPAFPAEEMERMKATLPAWKYAMFYEGQFVRPSGLIYEDYTDNYVEEGGHLVHPFSIPPEWPRYIGVDFGGAHTAILYLALDPARNIYYAYHESLEGGLTTKEHARRVRNRVEGTNFVTGWGGAQSETQWRRDWSQEGVHLLAPKIPDVEIGIDRVVGLFKTRRLHVFDTLSGLRDELGTYHRKMDESGQTTEQIADKETFHRLDSLRYLGMGLDLGSRWTAADYDRLEMLRAEYRAESEPAVTDRKQTWAEEVAEMNARTLGGF